MANFTTGRQAIDNIIAVEASDGKVRLRFAPKGKNHPDAGKGDGQRILALKTADSVDSLVAALESARDEAFS